MHKTIKFKITNGTFEIPRLGDVIEDIVTKSKFSLRMFGSTVQPDQPFTLNLLRLGMHNAYLDFESDNADFEIRYVLYDDLEIRRNLCRKEPNTDIMPLEWYTEIIQ